MQIFDVFSTEFNIISSSSGTIDLISTISIEIFSFSSFSAASCATETIPDQVTMVTSDPSRTIFPLPISTSYSPTGTSILRSGFLYSFLCSKYMTGLGSLTAATSNPFAS